ncbi:MAG: OB-fold domain-containing protein [Fimbriimonadia bacterium]|jgi:hypothetical protein
MPSVKLLKKGLEVLTEDPLVVRNPRGHDHIHTYGGLAPFYKGLREGKLMATRCPSAQCGENRLWLPPRPYCPDCWTRMEWQEVPPRGVLYTHSTVLYPGYYFRLSTPCPLISVEIEGVCTKLMSYLKEGEPEIGMPIRAVFNTKNPTNTILDLAWVPADFQGVVEW